MEKDMDMYRAAELNERSAHEQWISARGEKPEESRPIPKAHAERFRCAGCVLPLGFGPAEGIDGKAYHSGCAERKLHPRRESA